MMMMIYYKKDSTKNKGIQTRAPPETPGAQPLFYQGSQSHPLPPKPPYGGVVRMALAFIAYIAYIVYINYITSMH